MFGIKTHKHIPIQDNRMQPPQMVCSDPKCNALLGPAPVPTPEEIKEEVEEEQQLTEQRIDMEQKRAKKLFKPTMQKKTLTQPVELSKDQVLEMAIKRWGPALQVNQAVQECAELIHELTDALRGQANIETLSEEMADVEIMVAQLKMIYNNKEKIKAYKVAKLQRLAEIMLEPAKNTQNTENEPDEED